MKDLLHEILGEMKERVMNNLNVVKENESNIRKLLLNEDTFERAYQLQLHFKKNKKLLNENLDYLELQLKIVNLINKYGRTDFMKTQFIQLVKENMLNIDFYDETIKGNILFNENHPYYRDEAFIDKLLAHYLSLENFEECSRLTAIKKRVTMQ